MIRWIHVSLFAATFLVLAASSARAEPTVQLVPQRQLVTSRGIASADGHWAAARTQNGFAIWDLERGLLVRDLSDARYGGPAAFCGSLLFVGTDSKGKFALSRIDLTSGEERVWLEMPVTVAGACSPDGKKLALMFDSKAAKVAVYDVASATRMFEAPTRSPVGVVFRRNDRLLVAGQGRIEEIDLTSGLLIRSIDAPAINFSDSLAVTMDGARLVASIGSNEGLGAGIWNLDSGALEHRVQRKIRDFTVLAPSPALSLDGRRAAVFWGQTELAIVDVASGAVTETGRRHVSAVAYVQSGELAVLDGEVRYRADNGTVREAAKLPPAQSVSAVAFSPRGNLAFALAGARLVALRLPSLEQAWVRELDSTEKAFGSDQRVAVDARGLVVSPDGSLLATHAGSAIEVLEARTGVTRQRIADAPNLPTREALVFGDGSIALFVPLGTYLQSFAWSLTDGAKLPPGRVPAPPSVIARRADAGYSLMGRGAGPSGETQLPKNLGEFHDGLVFERSGDLFLDAGRKLMRWSPSKGTLASYEPTDEDYLWSFALAVSPDETKVAMSAYNTITLLDATTLKKLDTLRVSRSAPASLALDSTGRFLLEGRQDGTVELHSVEKKTSVTWLSDGTDWVAFQTDGTFHASSNGGRLVAAVRGFDAFRVDQLALKLNRPDRLYERLGIESPERIERLRQRHERRLAQVGLREADVDRAILSGPSANIDRLVQSEGVVDIEASFEDKEGLASYQVFVNDVPLYRPAPSLSGARQRVKERVVLNEGVNVIEISATNVTGLESFRAYRSVTWAGKAPRSLYFVGIGVSSYRNPDLLLEYAHKDALDLADVLRSAGAPFDAVHVRTVLDGQVTAQALDEARAWLADATAHDTVVVLVTGHGAYDEHGVYRYLLADTDVARLSDTAVSFSALEAMVSGIAPRKKLLLLDTCESGELLSDRASAPAAINGARSRGPRGATRTKLASAVPGARWAEEERSFLTNDLRRRTGAVVVSASRGDESSWERGDLENGVFTQAILEALTSREADVDSDGNLTTAELLAWVSTRVAGFTSNGQHPTIDRDNRLAAIQLPLILAARDIVDRKLPHATEATPPPAVSRGGCNCQVSVANERNPMLACLVAAGLLGLRRARRAACHTALSAASSSRRKRKNEHDLLVS